MSNYKFRLLGKTSWGIAIDISGNSSHHFSTTSSFIKINENLYFDADALPFSQKEYLEYLAAGLKWVSAHIDNTNSLLITFETVRFNYADFQEEGLFFAAAGWASSHFGFVMPDYKFHFDHEKHKYIFPLLNNISYE